jgi:hypothetical protein
MKKQTSLSLPRQPGTNPARVRKPLTWIGRSAPRFAPIINGNPIDPQNPVITLQRHKHEHRGLRFLRQSVKFASMVRLTKQEQMVLCIILGLLLVGWAVKAYRTAHPPQIGERTEH